MKLRFEIGTPQHGLGDPRPCWAKSMRGVVVMCAVCCFVDGCDFKQTSLQSGALQTIQSDYDAALMDATNSIPYGGDFARLFPGQRSSFSYYAGGAGSSSFNMEVLLFSRYQFDMKVPVTLKHGKRKVASFGDPEFFLLEVKGVAKIRKVGRWPDGSPAPAEQLQVAYNQDGQRRFGPKEWKRLVEAQGDFTVLGSPLITNSPAPGFDELRKDWENRRKIRP